MCAVGFTVGGIVVAVNNGVSCRRVASSCSCYVGAGRWSSRDKVYTLIRARRQASGVTCHPYVQQVCLECALMAQMCALLARFATVSCCMHAYDHRELTLDVGHHWLLAISDLGIEISCQIPGNILKAVLNWTQRLPCRK